jgi:predicted ATPase
LKSRLFRNNWILILKKAEGNPLFVEETLRMLIDRGSMLMENGSVVAGDEIETEEIPDTLQGLLLARIDCLPEEVKQTLRVASVIGRRIPVTVLEKVMGNGDYRGMLMEHLGTLETAGLIRVSQVHPEFVYIFRHSMLHGAAYTSLLPSDRKKLHLVVGEILEIMYPDRMEGIAPRLGHHFYEAGDDRRAFIYFDMSGDAAASSYANQEAESHYRRALDLDISEIQRADLILKLGQILVTQSRFKEAIQTWREGIELCQALGRPARPGLEATREMA